MMRIKPLAIILLPSLLLLMWTSASAATKGQLVYGETGRLEAFDPYTTHEASARRLSDLLFDSLITVGPGGQYEAGLATSWSVSPDKTSVTFQLRDNVLWHGSKNQTVDSQDVVTTIRLITHPSSQVPNKERFDAIKNALPRGPLKVEIRLKRAMVDPLRSFLFKILPDHKLAAAPFLRRNSDFGRHPVGTGPYSLQKANSQGEVILAANNSYFRGAPAIPTMILKSYSDQNIMAQSLMYNSLDLITYVSPRDVAEIAGDKKLGLVPYDALSFSFFAFNTSRGVLRDKRVRQALALAVNRQEMLDAFFQGKGRLITGPFPPTSWAYNIEVPGLKYDPVRAKQLLTNAGLRDRSGDGIMEDSEGKAFKLQFAVPLAGESEMIKRIVLAFQGYMQAVGVQVELQFMDWLVWKDKVLGKHSYDITLASWGFDDASNITSLFHSSSAVPYGNNFVMYRNPKVDALLTESAITNDFDKKRAIYQKLHSVLSDESPYIYLWTLQHHAAHNTKLAGVRVEPFSFFRHILSWKLGE